ncbi:MAG: hypothetical protein ABSA12_03695 [Verrucomicrobiia bacterium]
MNVGVQQPVPRWKQWAWRATLAVLGLSLFFGIWRFALDGFVAGQIAGIREKGYPVTLVELNRWYPRVAPVDNGAVLFDKAFAGLPHPSDRADKFQGDPAFVSSRPALLSAPPTQTTVDSLGGNDDVLALLHQASNAPRCRFPIDLRTLSIAPYRHLGNLIYSAHLLEADAANHAVCADPQPAVASVQSLFALSHALAKEPLVRSHLARLECQHIAVNSLQNLLNGTSLTDKQLDTLGDALDKADDQRGLARAFIGQRCIGLYGFDMMQHVMDLTTLPVARSYPLGQRFLINLGVFFGSPGYLYDLCGLLRWDELNYLRFMDHCVQTAQMPFPERIGATQALRQTLADESQLHSLSRAWLRGMNGPRVILKDAALAARLREARVAIAVERYRLAYNHLPQSLGELESSGIAPGMMPPDPFNGRPLRYTRLQNGFVVQSVCQNYADGNDRDGLRDAVFTVER